MSIYTKDIKEPGQEIYFLNDDNIAFIKNDMSCDAGFNAVASQKEFVEAYGEFGAVSSNLYALSGKTETSAAALDGKIGDVSAAADAKFLPMTGGTIDHLSVGNYLSINDRLSVGGGLTVRGLLDTDQIKTNSAGDITVRGVEGHGGINIQLEKIGIQLEDGINSISVGGASLSSYIRDSINELDVETTKAGAGKVFDEIGQRDGRISVSLRDLVSADIPMLPASKIESLEDDYATKQYALGRIGETAIQYDDDNHRIWVVNHTAGLSSYIDADRFIKDGMVESVTHEDGGEGHPVSEGPYIVITWNTASGKTQTWLKLREFASMYSSDDPGLLVGVGGDKFKLALNYDIVGNAADVSALAAYATELSTPVTGIIDTLSAGVDSALSSTALTVKFLGHITIYANEPRRSFTQILEDEQLFDELRRVKNGSMYQVTYLNSSGEQAGSETRYKTTDGLMLGDGDYVYVHKHGLDSYVSADEIVVSGDNPTVYLANPVHRYDVAELRQFVINNFVKLSGNNEISGGNLFHGVNSFDGAISVGFDRLFDMRDGKSLDTLSCEISAEIDNLSAALSTEIDNLSAALSTEIDNLSAALSGEIDSLSAALSGEIDSLSTALSTEIDSLSIALSGEIDNLSVALSGEIDSLSAALSGEIDSLSVALSGEIDSLSTALSNEIGNLSTALSGEIDNLSTALSAEVDNLSAALSGEIDSLSAALSGEIDSLSVALSSEIDNLSVALSGEIDDLSAALSIEVDNLSAALSGEIDSLSTTLSTEISARAMISVDGEHINEFKFLHISRDAYHDLVVSADGETTDPNTLYVVSSDDMCMYGEKITDLHAGELSGDACTYGQLQTVSDDLVGFKQKITSAIDEVFPYNELSNNMAVSFGAMVSCFLEIRNMLCAQV